MRTTILICLFLTAFATGCQSQRPVSEIEASNTLEVVSSAAPVEPTATLVFTNTPASPAPTETPLPPTATLPAPTETLSPATPLGAIDELVGTWKGYWSDTHSIYIEFKANGTNRVFFSGSDDMGDGGTFVVEGSQISWVRSTGSCEINPTATYEVLVIKRGDQAVQLMFTLVGEDGCVQRVEALDGKTFKWVEP